MRVAKVLLIIPICINLSCSKWEQRDETTVSATVVDPTTGQLTRKANVVLIEIETPSRPFTPLIRTIIEEFEVDYGESFSYSFNAKRGDRFEYFLEYQYPNFYFGDYGTSNGFYYEEQDMVELIKGSSNEYQLSVVPLAGVSADMLSVRVQSNPH